MKLDKVEASENQDPKLKPLPPEVIQGLAKLLPNFETLPTTVQAEIIKGLINDTRGLPDVESYA